MSISALIRFDSFASSLRQQAIMDSRVIPVSCCGRDPTRRLSTERYLSRDPEPSLRLQGGGRRRRWCRYGAGWMDRGTGGGEPPACLGPRCEVVSPSREQLRLQAVCSRQITGDSDKGREPRDGWWGLPEMLCLNAAKNDCNRCKISHLIPGLYH